MANIDITAGLKASPSLTSAAQTADVTGSSFEISSYLSACVVVNMGAYTDGVWSFSLEESDDNSTWQDSLDFFGTGIDEVTEGSQNVSVGYKGNHKYIRLKATVTGATTGAVFGATNVAANRSTWS